MSKKHSYFAESLNVLAPKLYEIRRKKGWTLSFIQEKFKYPAAKIEKTEMMQTDISLPDLAFLMRIYGKHLKIEIVD